ncbi:hypothetical protein BR93DRAFT_922991 [Coniochaeta sp. PMI_546]|nr:hypothetical protein BR93DRAFT_922991 [Coniochaeta sp. PMI_546]
MRSAVSILNDRGWIFQEQVLARRTLHYRRNSVSFSCYTHFASETLPRGVPYRMLNSPYVNLNTASESMSLYNDVHNLGLEMQVLRKHGPNYDGAPSSSKRGRLWYRAVQRYAHRLLTREEDRLEAISGLAEVLGASGDDYVAGLWISDLLAGLCWYTFCPRGQRSLSQTVVSRQDVNQGHSQDIYISPSWSWASACPAEIWFMDLDINRDNDVSVVPMALITDVYSLPSTPNPYGKVSDARVTITGRLMKTVIRAGRKKGTSAQLSWRLPSGIPTEPKKSEFWWDVSQEYARQEGVAYILPLRRSSKPLSTGSKGSDHYPYYFQGLILEQQSDGRYKREGYAKFIWTCAAVKGIEEQTVVIV